MNIKRAFLIAAAALALPGYAMAQTTVYFDTDLSLNPGGPFTTPPSVTATRTCNIGTPLQQVFTLDQGGVQFTAENFDPADPTFEECRISITALNGWEITEVLVNGFSETSGELNFPDCVYGPETVEGVAAIQPENTCDFRMIPATFTYEVEKVWEFDETSGVEPYAGLDIWCSNVFVGDSYDNLDPYNSWNVSSFFNETYTMATVSTLRINPTASGGTTSCYAQEYLYDSAIESDQGCQSGISFGAGDLGPKGCTITNSVFFEGIPTLSQYGLAVMALLMLGVGFIGFRRFV